MSIISTKKLLISLILVMGIMVVGIGSEVLSASVEIQLGIGEKKGETYSFIGNKAEKTIVGDVDCVEVTMTKNYEKNISSGMIYITGKSNGIAYIKVKGNDINGAVQEKVVKVIVGTRKYICIL